MVVLVRVTSSDDGHYQNPSHCPTNCRNKPIQQQCYLKDARQRMRTDMDRAARLGYHFAAKLVRACMRGGIINRRSDLI